MEARRDANLDQLAAGELPKEVPVDTVALEGANLHVSRRAELCSRRRFARGCGGGTHVLRQLQFLQPQPDLVHRPRR